MSYMVPPATVTPLGTAPGTVTQFGPYAAGTSMQVQVQDTYSKGFLDGVAAVARSHSMHAGQIPSSMSFAGGHAPPTTGQAGGGFPGGGAGGGFPGGGAGCGGGCAGGLPTAGPPASGFGQYPGGAAVPGSFNYNGFGGYGASYPPPKHYYGEDHHAHGAGAPYGNYPYGMYPSPYGSYPYGMATYPNPPDDHHGGGHGGGHGDGHRGGHGDGHGGGHGDSHGGGHGDGHGAGHGGGHSDGHGGGHGKPKKKCC